MIIIAALIGGLILGIIFFGGLWITVRKTLGTNYAAIWMLGSALIRTAVVLTGFYFISQGSLPRLLVSVTGFIAARFLVLRVTKKFEEKQFLSTESRHL
ncbi:ATP synthase subunit I [Dyadobacter sp. 3J3]|uniref:ATP synthase subunit I n=1 Tax=Dyadobacter sp. 3J3 TaxID=2606600 RepID=UPI00135BCE96|nr:ATP synthase subunit I [Dyadobacter sp. 3J3]